MAPTLTSRLDISHLDKAIHFFSTKVIADSTYKTYQSALRRFDSFCSLYVICHHFQYLKHCCVIMLHFQRLNGSLHEQSKLISQHLLLQVILGQENSPPYLSYGWYKEMGIQHTHSQRVSSPPRVCLPVTLARLSRLLVSEVLQARYNHIVGSRLCMSPWIFSLRGNNISQYTNI